MRKANWKRAATTGGAALIAAWLGACVNSGKEPEHLSGLVRNTCGSTDGPAVEVLFPKSGAGGCSDTGAVEARLFLDWVQVDSLVPGKSFLDSEAVCLDNSCRTSAVNRLQIESADGKSVQGTLETREKETNGGETIKRFEVDLTKCPRIIGWCG